MRVTGEKFISNPDWTPAQRRGSNNKSRGKVYERKVAKLLTKQWGKPVWRNPDSGMKAADCESDSDVIEVKSVTGPPYALLTKAWGQAADAAAKTGKTPHVVLCFLENGKRVYFHATKLEEKQDGI